MQSRKPGFFLFATIAGGACYPLLVYTSLHKIPAAAFVLAGVCLIGLRMVALRSTPNFKLYAGVFAITGCLLGAMLFISPTYAAQAYPVAVSLSVAALFSLSLIFPPTLVERIARVREPNLPPAGVAYTRKVTIVWAVFLVLNAALSTALAIWGTVGEWTLWTGLLSYLAMGCLFTGEYAIRLVVRGATSK